VQPDGVNPASWDDTWAFSLGVIYEHDDKWTFRSGTGFLENPIPLAMRNPRIPDSDRWELGFGCSYRWSERTTIDFSSDAAPARTNARSIRRTTVAGA